MSITQPTAGAVRLAWADVPPGFVLEYSGQLYVPVLWDGVSSAPSLVGPNRVVDLSLASLGGVRGFFRLVPKGPPAGLDYLIAHQNANGSWGPPGGASANRDTEVAASALALFGLTSNDSSAHARGLGALGQFAARNFDELARRTIAFVGGGRPVATEVATLIAGQSPSTNETTALGYPGYGWGLADGFGSTPLDTALVLRALRASGRNGGLSVVADPVAGGATTAARTFIVPAGSSAPVLRVRARTTSFRFRLTYPSGGGTFTVDLAAGTTPTDVAFPVGSGTLSLSVQNLTGTAGTYSAEVGYTGPDGFDYFRIATALSFLGLKQNGDGGWSVVPGEDSHFLVTAEVLRALAAVGTTFVSPATAAGTNWLLARQNGDGGFSAAAGASNSYETALAMLAVRDASPATSLLTSSAYLRAAQLPNGSWDNDVVTTALAVQALKLPPVVTAIPNQTVSAPTAFATIALDNFVSDPDHADSALTWSATGNTLLTVAISPARVATITYPAATSVLEDVTFIATDPDGNASSATARFTVNYSVADHTIARGAFATGTRSFTTTPTVISQTAFYTQSISGLPAGYTYNTTGVRLFSGGTVEIDYRIDIGGAAALGVQSFGVTYGLLDAGSNPLGPLTGNNFTFTIQVTP